MSDLNQNREKPPASPGFAIMGCFVVGVIGVIAAIGVMFDVQDFRGGGICLVAAALAFGLAANAVFRK
jgi:hypothetical protein